jgi:hypothetical protein
MGIRGEIFSKKVLLRNRSYFFNVKETRTGDLYLNIVESKNMEGGGFDRQSVILFAEDLQEFLQGFDEALRTLERSVHEKKRAAYKNMPNAPAKGGAFKDKYSRRTETDKPFGTGKPSGKLKPGRPVRVFRKNRSD